MNFVYFVGIDVGKQSLDFAVVQGKETLLQEQIPNTVVAIRSFVKKLKSITGGYQEVVFCMEHTGIYNYHLLNFLQKEKACIWMESSLRIKRSMGLQRGKNDRIDALRIAQYAFKSRDEVRLWQPSREVVRRLKAAASARKRLISAKKQLLIATTEFKGFDKLSAGINKKLCSDSIKALENGIEKADKEIEEIISSDPELKRLFTIVTSVDGVGPAVATEVLVNTNEFKDITDPSKYACYAGVAPFEYSSGTSVRGRTKVSHIANKNAKTLLHMAAMSAMLCNPELKVYYQRKVSEGKHKMAVINAIRNKMIWRIFACVRDNRPFGKNYSSAFVKP